LKDKFILKGGRKELGRENCCRKTEQQKLKSIR
jgi:hypothetical protein